MKLVRFIALGAAMLISTAAFAESHQHTSTPFQGPQANTGTVSHSRQGNKMMLTLSDDFKVPDTPDPHWQVVDSRGRTYLLEAMKLKEGVMSKSITLPAYVPDVAKVQVWCAFAQVLLGEASFSAPVK